MHRSRRVFIQGTSALRPVTVCRFPPNFISMLRRCSIFAPLCFFLLVAACSTAPQKDSPLRIPAPAQKSAPAPSSTEPVAKLAPGEFAVLVESEPAGGIVVLNGVPLGRTPQRIVLTGTSRGFIRDAVSIKVRFVAADTDHTSQTVEEQLTPLDKIPARLHFTPTGSNRVAR